MNTLYSPFHVYSIGSSVEVTRDTRSIGGVISAHVCYGTIERYTAKRVVIRNEHGNLMRAKLADSQVIGSDILTPSRIIKL
jgi:hypothetical protein